MYVVDLKINPQSELWRSTVEFIRNSTDNLKNNYLNINFDDFLNFPCVIDHEKIICFSGLQYDISKWGDKIARCSSRLWTHPDYRIHGLKKFTGGPAFLNTTHCLPLQLEKARELDLDVIFISKKHNLLGFQEYINLIGINCNVKFTISDNIYNVCGKEHRDIEDCRQYVALHYLNSEGEATWEKEMLNNTII